MTSSASSSATPPESGPAEGILGEYARRFRHRNGRSPRSSRIHAVLLHEDWIGDTPLAVPACGAGVGGTTGRLLEPTTAAVTCLRCLALTAARAAAAAVPTPHQYSLDELLPVAS